MVPASLADSQQNDVCVDTGCTISLIDRNFLNKHDLRADIRKMNGPIIVCGICGKTHVTSNYVILKVHLHGTINAGALVKDAPAMI